MFPCPRSRLIIWSREIGSAVPSRVSPFIIHAPKLSLAMGSREIDHSPMIPLVLVSVREAFNT